MASVQDVIDAVAAEKSVEDGVVTLLDGLAAQLADVKNQLAQAGVDTAALDGVVASINANKEALADAVTRDTPAA